MVSQSFLVKLPSSSGSEVGRGRVVWAGRGRVVWAGRGSAHLLSPRVGSSITPAVGVSLAFRTSLLLFASCSLNFGCSLPLSTDDGHHWDPY